MAMPALSTVSSDTVIQAALISASASLHLGNPSGKEMFLEAVRTSGRSDIENDIYGQMWNIKGRPQNMPEYGRLCFNDGNGFSSTLREKASAIDAYLRSKEVFVAPPQSTLSSTALEDSCLLQLGKALDEAIASVGDCLEQNQALIAAGATIVGLTAAIIFQRSDSAYEQKMEACLTRWPWPTGPTRFAQG